LKTKAALDDPVTVEITRHLQDIAAHGQVSLSSCA
jgi:hypothetical protein